MSIVARKKIRGRRGGAPGGRATPSVCLLSFAALAVMVVGLALWLSKGAGDAAQLKSPTPEVAKVPPSRETPTPSAEQPAAPPQPKGEPDLNSAASSRQDVSIPSSDLAEEPQEGLVAVMTGTQSVKSVVQHFPHPTEDLLAIMLSTPPDSFMPPLPLLDPDDERLNADAIAAITNALVIYEEDSEELAGLKERVAELKEQLADAIANGGNVADILNEFRNWQNEGVDIRNKAIADINAIEDDNEAAKALEDANKAFEQEGVIPIRPVEVGFDDGAED